MKIKINLLVFCLLLMSMKFTAQIRVELYKPDVTDESIDLTKSQDVTVSENKPITSIKIKASGYDAKTTLKVSALGEEYEYLKANADQVFTFKSNLLMNEVTIKHFAEDKTEITADQMTFRLIYKSDDGTKNIPQSLTNNEPSIDDYLAAYLKTFSKLKPKPYGYIDEDDADGYIHLFFDQYGNSLLSTIPQGISNAQYKVHIIYPISSKNPNKTSYSVKQTAGEFSSALLFNNTNILSQVGKLQSGDIYDAFAQRTFILGTSTNDLTFDIVATTKGDDNKVSKTVLETYTIKMSPVFHGSFDVGFLQSNLPNPDYSLVQLPNSPDMVVKETNRNPQGVVTIMASCYVSPVVLLEKLFKLKKFRQYQLTGRSFLDDHKFYERIYPTIGVGINNKALENFYYGFNWEIARGFCVFGGWHTGKVNTFEMPGYQANVTPVTADQFEFYKNTKWKTSTAFGVKLDIMIVRNLFGISSLK